MRHSKSSVEYEQRLREFEAVTAQVFTSPNGRRLLEILKQRYVDPQMFDRDPLVMARNVGQYDLVNELIKLSEGGADDN